MPMAQFRRVAALALAQAIGICPFAAPSPDRRAAALRAGITAAIRLVIRPIAIAAADQLRVQS